MVRLFPQHQVNFANNIIHYQVKIGLLLNKNILQRRLQALYKLGRSLVISLLKTYLFLTLQKSIIAIYIGQILQTSCRAILILRGYIERHGSLYSTSYLIQQQAITTYYCPIEDQTAARTARRPISNLKKTFVIASSNAPPK